MTVRRLRLVVVSLLLSAGYVLLAAFHRDLAVTVAVYYVALLVTLLVVGHFEDRRR